MKYTLKSVAALSLSVILLFSAGCAQSTSQAAPEAPRKLQVITTLFPLYDFSKTLMGDAAEVSLLLPPGVEPHAFEPTPQDIVRISKGDVFIYTGEAMEPWVHELLAGIDNPELLVIDASQGIALAEEEDHGPEDEAAHAEEKGEDHAPAGEEGTHHGVDPHIWLDPVLAQQMTATIAEGLKKAVPDRAAEITAAEGTLRQQLEALHQKYVAALGKTQYNEIVYGGHFAFGYLARRYGLEHVSPYDGFSPDAEPTPAKIAALIQTLKTTGTKTIYFEELIDPKVARVIAEETGAKMLMLHGAHNVSKAEMESGITYIAIMEQNLENLKEGLGYRE